MPNNWNEGGYGLDGYGGDMFFEVEFPRKISYRAVGGPGFNTTINEGFSGFEQRNKNWATARGKWQISLTTPVAFAGNQQAYADLLQSFFLNVGGMFDGFRLYDHLDNKGTAQLIGTGDGTTKAFQLQKTYTVGSRSYVRTISKPITGGVTDYQGNTLADTVKIYLGGVLQPTSAYTTDNTTGIVTFVTAPALNVVITADFSYHYPVRFDTDDLGLQREESNVSGGQPIVTWSGITLKEIRISAGQG